MPIKDKLILVDSDKNIEDSLSSGLGERYSQLYDYKLINIPLLSRSVVLPKFFDTEDLDIPSFSGSDDEIIQSGIDYVKKFDYNRFTSDPNTLKKLGEGNCQAMSLTFSRILDKYDIQNEVVIEGEHMYNKIILDDKNYLIDFTNNTFNVVEAGV